MKRFMNKKGRQTTDNRQQTLSMFIKRLMTHGSWLIVLILFISSCSSEKKVTKSTLKSYAANHIVKEIEKNEFDFDRLEAKLNVKVKGDNNLNLKGQIRMEKDSVIWISLSMKIGVEVGRIMITQDSIKFINRTARTYIAESLGSFSKNLPIESSINFIQDILVGNDNQIQKGDKFKVSTENDRYKLEISNREKKIKNNHDIYIIAKDLWVVPETFRISKYKIKEQDNDKRKIQLQYDNFQQFNDKFLPTRIEFELTSGYNMNLEIDYSSITIGEKLEFPFNISKKYDRINLW